MDNKKLFSKFSSILESEILDDVQMNALEAGSSCEESCKKSCKPGNQNTNIGNGSSLELKTRLDVDEKQKRCL